jgi:hypothetical protein
LLQTNGTTGHWLTVSLSSFAPGATLRATLPNGRVLIQELRCGSSYLSSEDDRFHLGLGMASQVQHLVITLPDGRQMEYDNVPADQILEVSIS